MAEAISEERRSVPRVPVDLPVQIQVVFPEATFTPVMILGRICDLTREGARVRIREVSEAHAKKIILGPRNCRLHCQFPTSDGKGARIFGKIVNFILHDSPAGGAYFLGVDFGENEVTDLAHLAKYLDSLASTAE